MNILAVDAAAATLSIALAADGDIWLFEADAGQRHSELLLGGVDYLLRQAGRVPADLAGVACMGGPGSFTGLRIGFAFAKGLALSLGIPFVAIPSLDCMAHPFSAWPGLVAPAIDAKKSAFFCALYRNGERLTPPMDAAPAAIATAIATATAEAAAATADASGGRPCPVLLAGPDAEKLRDALTGLLPPSLAGLLRIAAPAGGCARALLELCRRRVTADGALPENTDADWFSGPLYIRKSDAELQRASPS
jgi:tRNA threonylcarbamoyladenosine biosynthesis protein TsaB